MFDCLPPRTPAGEINTLQGNLNWVASRQAGLRNEVWRGREHDFLPLCSDRGGWGWEEVGVWRLCAASMHRSCLQLYIKFCWPLIALAASLRGRCPACSNPLNR